MRISLRILAGYFLVVGLAAYFVLNVFVEEVKPGVRQAMEENLVDTAQLLAELAGPDLRAGTLDHGAFAAAVDRYRHRSVDVRIWSFAKRSLDYRIYVTDAQGKVVFDSNTEHSALGEDYSRWRDVYLTLRGQYGARSTPADPGDERSSVMHIAAPVLDGKQVIGVLTVAKPNLTAQPYIERSERKIRDRGLILVAGTILIGALFTWWLTSGIHRLHRYAGEVAAGERVPLPNLGSSELADLGRALEAMREKLEGKQYVERYVHALTHEMKSPLAAIRGAAELLQEADMPAADRQRFLANIGQQEARLRRIIDRLLELATLEQRRGLEQPEAIALEDLVRQQVEAMAPRLAAAGVQAVFGPGFAEPGPVIQGERFLLEQAVANLLENAVDFSPPGGRIFLKVEDAPGERVLWVEDEGSGIPDYALPRIFERFYSLPRPRGGDKSSGLGLPFVAEVAALHRGRIVLDNRSEGGCRARLGLPSLT